MGRILLILVALLFCSAALANIIIGGSNCTIFDNNGQPWNLTSIVQGENYDQGGEGIAFHAASNCGMTPVYRTGPDWDNVIAEGTQYGVDCNQIGDWQRTTVSVPSQGSQQFTLSMALTGAGDASHNFTWEIDTCDPTCTQLTTIPVTTGANGVFGIFTSGTFTLSAGTHVIRRFCQSAASGFCGDVDYMQAAVAGSPTISSLSVTPTVFAVPVSPPTTIAQLAASCSVGSCAAATFSMSANFACSGAASANNANFATSGSNLNDATAIPGPGPIAENVGIAVTLAGATNSGGCFPQTLQAGGVPCDVGVPFLGTIPRVAQATGMTRCAFNFDATNATYANVNTWLNCAGASSPVWYLDTTGNNNPACGNITITADATGGVSQVVDLHYTAGTADTQILSSNSNGSVALTFPQNSYRDVVYRIPAASYAAANQPSLIMANWGLGICWLQTNNFNCASNVEFDNIEQGCNSSGCTIPQNGGDSAWHDWNVGGSNAGNEPVNGSPLADANYHSYGILTTADGSAHLGMCSYQDESALASANGTNCDAVENRSPVNAAWFTQRSYAINTVGPQSLSLTGYGSLDVFLRSFTIWVPASCTTWQTTECNGGPVYESTPP